MIGQKGVPATFGGVERYVDEVGGRLARRGHDVTVYCRRHYTVPEIASHRGMRIVMLPSINTKHLDAITHTALSTLHALGSGYDIVHYHALGPSTLAFGPQLTGARVVSTCHGLDWMRKKWGRGAGFMLKRAEWASARFPHLLITVSRTLKDYFDRRFGIDAVHVPNGVEVPDRLAPPDLIGEKHGLSAESYVLFMARLTPEKGCHTLIDAFRDLETDARLVVAGGSSHTDRYVESLRERASGDGRILFTGYVTGAEKEELLSNAAAYVLPSDLEGLPIGLLEGMAYGRCCVASDIPENLEVIDGDGDPVGVSFVAGDAQSLRRTLAEVLRDRKRAGALGEAARDFVRRRHDWDAVALKIESLYGEVLAAKRR